MTQQTAEPVRSVEELRQLAAGRGDPTETLNSVVRLIRTGFHTNVCSVYLLEPDRTHLIVAATYGLRPERVRKVRTSLQEGGLAGLVAQELRPIVVEDVAQHPRFKHFPKAGEDAYHSFFGLPLLDSDVADNSQEDRDLTARLYGGDNRTRIRQVLLLGVGGVRALNALGIKSGVLHMKEIHSAFAALEVARMRMRLEGIELLEAAQRVARRNIFTTHTPVPAGHDWFPPAMVEEHLGPLRDALAIPHNEFMGLGRVDLANHGEAFCMAVLALKLSRRAHAVSALHGRVSRDMWSDLWPGRPAPIGHITNGVHVLSWLAPQMRTLYENAIAVPTGRVTVPSRPCGPVSTSLMTGNCGRHTRHSRRGCWTSYAAGSPPMRSAAAPPLISGGLTPLFRTGTARRTGRLVMRLVSSLPLSWTEIRLS